ncbi:MAG: hypothetical protein QOC95_2084 [Thermoleophilaceae bacterium]|nr:hypothetical protein [Thermoleophilaceae bacterium]
MQPAHPDESGLHRQLRDALNESLASTNFLVWITVEASGDGTHLSTTREIVLRTEQWLSSLDPETIPTPEAIPEMAFTDPAAEVRIRAIPKKPEARGYRSQPIVGNPEPAVAGWV